MRPCDKNNNNINQKQYLQNLNILSPNGRVEQKMKMEKRTEKQNENQEVYNHRASVDYFKEVLYNKIECQWQIKKC